MLVFSQDARHYPVSAIFIGYLLLSINVLYQLAGFPVTCPLGRELRFFYKYVRTGIQKLFRIFHIVHISIFESPDKLSHSGCIVD